jgi:oligoribonuclease NrnB/cAMP/cGMP phosphodiesterase (DHH superfamily)
LPEKFHLKKFLKGCYAISLCDRKDLTSELGSKILEKFENINYVMLIYDGGIALRSVGDFDVSEIAKKYGGGGHKNAAGFLNDEWYKFLL